MYTDSRFMAENKLILLYIFYKLDMPLTNIQVTKIVLENSLMNYFSMQLYFSELVNNHYIEVSEDVMFYKISAAGVQTLEYLSGKIPPGIKAIIDTNAVNMKKQLITQKSVTADFTPVSEKEYIVNCKITEGDFNLIDLKLTVGTKKDARTICSNWRNNAQEMYLKIIQTLTSE